MIISASVRTDIPAFHSHWFGERLKEGFVDVTNPYNRKPYRVELAAPIATGFVFWSRNYGQFTEYFEAVDLPFYAQMTITGYPRAIERAVPSVDVAVEQVREIAARFGKTAVVWRYDPIFVCDQTEIEWHKENFASIAKKLSGIVTEVSLSFCQSYRKSERNILAAAKSNGFQWRDPCDEEKRETLGQLAEIAHENQIQPTLCSQPDLLVKGLAEARCIDASRLAKRGMTLTKEHRTKGTRPGCLCDQCKDIGAYESCGHGCCYCYAVNNHERVRKSLRASASDNNAGF